MIKYEAMLEDLVNRVRRGQVAADAVDDVWRDWRVPEGMYSYTKQLIYKDLVKELGVSSIRAAGGVEIVYSNLIDDKAIRTQIMTTSARMRTDIKAQMNTAIKRGQGLWETAKNIRNAAFEAGADSATAAEFGLQELYKSPLKDEVRVIQRRLNAGIKTDQLRYSYEKLIDAAENMDVGKLLKQEMYTMKAKLKSQGERVYRTESSRAINAAKAEKIASDPNVKLVQIVLEHRHHHTSDVCDCVASADCGYGAGVYPLDRAPVLPLHPNCNCRLYPVYINDGKQNKTVDSAIGDVAQSLDLKHTDIAFRAIRPRV